MAELFARLPQFSPSPVLVTTITVHYVKVKIMEVSLAEAAQIMEQHYQRQDFSALATLAKEITQQRPEQPAAWRFLGIAALLSGGDGEHLCFKLHCWEMRKQKFG